MTALGWLASACLLGGTFLVARRCPIGWLLRMAGGAGWFAFAIYTSNYPLAALNGAFVLIDTVGLVTWEANNDSSR